MKNTAFKAMAEACAAQALDEGIKNYAGEIFTITPEHGPQFEVVVTVQKVGAKSVQEVNEDLRELLNRVVHSGAMAAFERLDELEAECCAAIGPKQ